MSNTVKLDNELVTGARAMTAILAATALLVSACNPTSQTIIASDKITVIDGDTIRIGDNRYRLTGFDTPETYFAKCESERERGNNATRRLKRIIQSESDVVLIVDGQRDRYDRYLARLEVAGQDVGPILIAAGLARPYHGGKRGMWCN